jgi:hypothetical protein
MYIGRMKRTRYKVTPQESAILKEQAAVSAPGGTEPMVRTQIYLSRAEHDFVQAEAARRNEPMASVIRRFIDEHMGVSDAVWNDNPLLQPPVHDPDYVHPPDGVVNHDHYIYGGPKTHKKVKGKWVPLPPEE